MGKKRIIKEKRGGSFNQELKSRAFSKLPKKKLDSGIVYIRSTYNNTAVSLTDKKGNYLYLVAEYNGEPGFYRVEIQ